MSAIAGRVAIVPKGTWNSVVSYQKLDAVSYEDGLYIAKTDVSAGTLPTDTSKWMFCVGGGTYELPIASTETLGGVKIDGTTITIDEDGTIHADVSEGTVKSVNHVEPDENGNVELTVVDYADNLTSDDAQTEFRAFIIDTSGGSQSIADGDAWVSSVQGNAVKTGYSAEVLTKSIVPAMSYSFDRDTFVAEVNNTSGTYVFTYDGSDWYYDNNVVDITDYGVTITVPEENAQAYSSNISLEVEVDASDFGTAVSNVDGNYAFSYDGTDWTYLSNVVDLADYGVTVSGGAVEFDTITVVYRSGKATLTVNFTAENRGTITVATPTAFKSTGWNLYQSSNGYAYVAGGHQYKIGGAYTSVTFSTTTTGQQTPVSIVDGFFNIADNGYVFVVGGNDTTYIYLPWTDWTEGYEGAFQTFTESTVILPTVDTADNPLPHTVKGLCAVGTVRDEINSNTFIEYDRIERMTYSAANLAIAQASGRDYDYDTNYIYLVRATPVTYMIPSGVLPDYTVSDHGIEYFVGSQIPVYAQTLYGRNLKDYLRHDVPNAIDSRRYTVETTDWVANTDSNTNTVCPYVAVVSDSDVTVNSVSEISFESPTNVLDSDTEQSEVCKIREIHSANGQYILYAVEALTVNMVMVAKGR